MAEPNTVEKEAKAEAAFGVGFGDTPPAAIPPVKVVEEPAAEPATPAAVAPAPVPERPQYVRLTKQEWDNTKAAAGKVSILESQLAKLTGSMPKAEQIVQQAIEAVRTQTPSGAKVTVTPEDFAELGENFEELSGMTMKGLQRVLDRFNVTGTATSASLDEGTLAKAVETVLTGREQQALEKTHPTWRDIVGAVDVSAGETPSEANTFRQWLATQSPAYQEEINATDSPAVVQSAIDRFLAVPKPAPAAAKPDKAAARRAVIADAETPRAEGHAPPLNPPPSVEEAFASGFKTGKPH